nr:hypothetical protein [Serratia marcescens]
MLEANQPLNVVWLMKTALKELWYAPSEQEAQRRWASWYRQSNKGIATLCRETERVCRGYHRECQAQVEYQRTGRDEQ